MAYSFKNSEKLVIFFIFSAIVTLLIIIVLIVSQKNLFRSGNYYYAELKSARGIKQAIPITLQDIQIGSVKTVYLSDINTVNLKVFIYKDFVNRIRKESVLVLKTQLIGGIQLVLYPAPTNSSLTPEGGYIETSDTSLGSIYKRRYESKTAGNADIDLALENVNTLMQSLNNPDYGLSSVLFEFNSILTEFNLALTNGNIGYILNNPDSKRILESSFSSLETILSNTYSLTYDLSRFSRMLNNKTIKIEKIIDNTEILSSDLIKTVNYMNTMMPYMIKLTSNSAIIASNLVPVSKDLSKMKSKLK